MSDADKFLEDVKAHEQWAQKLKGMTQAELDLLNAAVAGEQQARAAREDEVRTWMIATLEDATELEAARAQFVDVGGKDGRGFVEVLYAVAVELAQDLAKLHEDE